jgi:hypothetical protein
MAITVTTILGTDSLTASRPIINDNFNILKDEINAIEAYIDPDAGTIDGLVSLQTGELRVGPVSSYYMEISSSVFNINNDITFTSPTAVMTVNGLIAHDSFAVLDSNITGSSVTVDPTTGNRNYTIKNTSATAYTISVGDGYFGQEVTFSCEQIVGSIDIQAAGTSQFVFGTSTAYTNQVVSLNEAGSNITLRYMQDSSGNGSWYAVAYHNVTFS